MDKLNFITLDPGYGFLTPYLLVYGTLRKDQGNYNTLLKGKVAHHGTFRLKGFALADISAKYTGNPNHSLVVDLFEIEPERSIPQVEASDNISWLQTYEVNFLTDDLEGVNYRGYYNTTILKIKHEEQEIYAKIYLTDLQGDISQHKSYNPNGDFVSKVWVDYPILQIAD